MFDISLHVPDIEVTMSIQEPALGSSDNGQIDGLLDSLCDYLGEIKGIEFQVNWAGEHWPVDIVTDLPVVLEQLPDLVYGLSHEKLMGGVLDFYEQGIQRLIEFTCQGELVKLECRSYSERWEPPLAICLMPRELVKARLQRIADTFISVVQRFAPGCVETKAFSDWAKRISSQDIA